MPAATPTRIRLAALGVVALLAVGAAGASAAGTGGGGTGGGGRAAPAEPSLTGSAKLLRPDGDDVRFTFGAHGEPDTARGTFGFRHIGATERGFATGRIDCLASGGKVAVATGVVERTDVEGLEGLRIGFTVHDTGRGKPDRVGYSWAGTNDPTLTKDLPPCVSSAPFETVERGDFTVVTMDAAR
ncbi:hypothetical protein [Streptomyces sp. NPDC057676]